MDARATTTTMTRWRPAGLRASAAVLLGCAALALLNGHTLGQATLPVGGTVASGQVKIGAPTGNALTINQTSSRAIVDWQSFSVGAGGSVNFIQPGAGSAILNRVTGATSSTIAGEIAGNGEVFLVNPNGIAITRSGAVRVGGGFVASTLDIGNADFNAGNLVFSGSGASAAVSNSGRIIGAPGSFIGLIGGTVANDGLISVPLGKVGLGAGEKVTLDPNGDGFLQVALPTSATAANGQALIDVAGRIKAAGGSVEIKTATAQQALHDVVNVSGSVSARSVAGRPGRIVLDGGGGAVTVSGRLAANGGRRRRGGTIVVSGSNVALTATAKVSANGSSGGVVLIGGDRHGGADPTAKLVTAPVGNAQATSIASGATISANGVTGDGGNVVVWSDALTDFRGTIDARGGAGSGGAVEVSSHGVLNYAGAVDVTATSGNTGSLLLDPFDVTISSGSDNNISNSSNTFSPNGNSSILSVTTLQSALATANVTVDTGSSGAQSGDITVASPVTWSSSNTLALNAAGAIAVNAPIVAGSGGLNLSAGSPSSAISVTGAVNVGTLTISQGTWSQNTSSLPALYAGSFSIGANASFLRAAGGAGTAGSPYLLTDIYGVQGIGSSAIYLGSSYKLANDVDASVTSAWNGGSGFNPIGTSSAAAYVGTFDGGTYAIANLFINRGSSDRIGLFGYISGATVRNLYLLNANVAAGSVSGLGHGSGALVGVADNSTIQNVAVTGAMTGVAGGGLNDCCIGGIVGQLYNGSVLQNSAAAVNVTSAVGRVGGAVGSLEVGGAILNVSATGNVSAPGQTYVGGLVGAVSSNISNSYATGAVTGSSNVGGFLGFAATGTISNSYSTGAVTGGFGFAGAGGATFTNDYWNTQTSGQSSDGVVGTSGLTTAQMQSQANFSGFDFSGTWFQTAGYFPTLRGGITILGPSPGASAGNLTVSTAADTILTNAGSTTNINTTSLQNLLGVGDVLVSTTSGTVAVNNDVSWSNNLLRLAANAGVTTAANFTSTGGGLGLTSSAVTVNGGTINLGGALQVLGSASGSNTAVTLNNAAISVGSGASAITGISATGNGVNFTGSSSVIAGAGGALTVSGTNTGSTVVAATQFAANAGLTTAGSVALNGASTDLVGLVFNGSNTLTASSGNLTLTGNAVVDAGLQFRGAVNLTNAGASTFAFNGSTNTYRGLELLGAAGTDVTVSGNASFTGASNTGTGVIFGNASTFDVTSGNVTVNGTSTTIAGTGAAIGTRFATATVTNSGGGSLAITGTSDDAAAAVNSGSAGVLLTGPNSLTNSGAGTLSLSGINTSGYGLQLASSATLATSGTMSLAGTSSAGYGLFLGGTNTVTAASGNLSLSGSSASNLGMELLGTSSITNSGAGTLALNATGNVDLQASLSSSNGPLTFAGAGTVTQSAGTITAGSLLLSGSNGAFTLNASGNTIGTLAASVQSLAVNDGSALTIGTVAATSGVTASSTATLVTTGNLTIAPGAPINAASPVLAAAGAFINNAGSAAVTAASGRWLVYSSAPGGDTFGGLNSGNTAIWNATNGTLPPGSVSAAGNRYLFASQPTLTFTSTNDAKTYGTDATAAVASDYTVSGFQSGVSNAFLGDNAGSTFTGSPALTSSGAAATASVAGGPYAISVAQGSLAAISGYALAFNSAGSLTVNPAPVTVTALGGASTYGASPANPGLSATGLQNGQSVAVLTGLSNSFGITNTTGVGSYTMSVAGSLTNSNYTLAGTNTGSWTVNPHGLTVTAFDQSKTYGATAALGTSAFSASGLINGDSVNSVTLSSTGTAAAATVAGGPYAIVPSAATGSGLSNYAISYVNGSLTVNPAPVTVTALGGTSTYGASPANPGLSAAGLQNGESAAVLTGLLNSFGITGTSNVGSYTLAVAGSLTNGNYSLAATNPGIWIVTPPGGGSPPAAGPSPANGPSPSNPSLLVSRPVDSPDNGVLNGLAGAAEKVNAGMRPSNPNAPAAASNPAPAVARSAPASPSRAAQPNLSSPPATEPIAPAPAVAANAEPGRGCAGTGAMARGDAAGESADGCVAPAPRKKVASVIDFALSHLNRDALVDAVNREFRDVVQSQLTAREVMIVSLAGGTIAITAGLIGWLLRGGALFGAFLTAMPLWREFDPLVVMQPPQRRSGSGRSLVDAVFEDIRPGSGSTRRGRS